MAQKYFMPWPRECGKAYGMKVERTHAIRAATTRSTKPAQIQETRDIDRLYGTVEEVCAAIRAAAEGLIDTYVNIESDYGYRSDMHRLVAEVTGWRDMTAQEVDEYVAYVKDAGEKQARLARARDEQLLAELKQRHPDWKFE